MSLWLWIVIGAIVYIYVGAGVGCLLWKYYKKHEDQEVGAAFLWPTFYFSDFIKMEGDQKPAISWFKNIGGYVGFIILLWPIKVAWNIFVLLLLWGIWLLIFCISIVGSIIIKTVLSPLAIIFKESFFNEISLKKIFQKFF